jgi:hypothetical protein
MQCGTFSCDSEIAIRNSPRFHVPLEARAPRLGIAQVNLLLAATWPVCSLAFSLFCCLFYSSMFTVTGAAMVSERGKDYGI